MRGGVEGLASPQRLGALLPPIYYDDAFAQGLTAGLDVVLAPVLSVLDNLAAYLDPSVAPSDFVEWLAGWVGVALDENWPSGRGRTMVAQAAELYRRRGTVRGLKDLLTLAMGIEAEIEESGGASWSVVPGGAVPGDPVPHMTVRLRIPGASEADRRQIETAVAANAPADVPYTIEVIGR